MAETRTIGNHIAPRRFIVFITVLLFGAIPASLWLDSWWLGIIDAFDVAVLLFLLLCWRLIAIDDPAEMERIARLNDANRSFLLILTGIVMAVLLIAVGAVVLAFTVNLLASGGG